MKFTVKASSSYTSIPTIHIQMFIKPIFYEDSRIASSVEFDKHTKKWVSDNNPSRIINDALFGPGEELGSPISEEYDRFIDDCKFIIKQCGFIIIHSERSDTSNKSEYILMFGMKNKPYGRLVFDFRISDHALKEQHFPDRFKEKAKEYLTMNHILDGTAQEQEIDFQVDKVLVGNVQNDTWNRALNRLADRLKILKSKVQIATKLHTDGE